MDMADLVRIVYEPTRIQLEHFRILGITRIRFNAKNGSWLDVFLKTLELNDFEIITDTKSNDTETLEFGDLNSEQRMIVLKYYFVAELSPQVLQRLCKITHRFVLEDFDRFHREYRIVCRYRLGNGGSMHDSESVVDAVLANFELINLDLPKKPTLSHAFHGYKKLYSRLQQIINIFESPSDFFEKFGIPPISGILIYGPSGVGKSHLVNQLICQSQLNYTKITVSEIYSKYLGESEFKIREIFKQASLCQPCCLVIDHIDSIGKQRDIDNDGNSVDERVLSTLLNEINGISETKGIFLIGITSRLELVDDALKRPGRFDFIVEMKFPTLEDRQEILGGLCKRFNLSKDNIDTLAIRSEGFSCADLVAWTREAAQIAIKECRMVKLSDFLESCTYWRPKFILH
jgi:AAA+ superfamily predicted ATPase